MKTGFATLVEATSTPLASIFGTGFLVIALASRAFAFYYLLQ